MYRYRLSLIMLFLFGITMSSISAQDYTYKFTNISTDDGLLDRRLRHVFESKNGLIWLGLDKGLQQYDGHNFKSWTRSSETGDIFSISDIEEDNEGWLWLYNSQIGKIIFSILKLRKY